MPAPAAPLPADHDVMLHVRAVTRAAAAAAVMEVRRQHLRSPNAVIQGPITQAALRGIYAWVSGWLVDHEAAALYSHMQSGRVEGLAALAGSLDHGVMARYPLASA
jgi:hypothetical protein